MSKILVCGTKFCQIFVAELSRKSSFSLKDYSDFLQVLVNLLGSSLVGSKEGEATLSTAFQTHHKG